MWLFGPSKRQLRKVVRQELDDFYTVLDTIRQRQRNNAHRLIELQRLVNKWILSATTPGTPGIKRTHEGYYKGEPSMPDMIYFQVQLPAEPPKPNDIVGGQLVVKTTGNKQRKEYVIQTKRGQRTVDSLEDGTKLAAPQNGVVDLEFRYIDDAGNLSQPATRSEVMYDTIAPQTPVSLGITATGEAPELVEEPEPEPEPEPDNEEANEQEAQDESTGQPEADQDERQDTEAPADDTAETGEVATTDGEQSEEPEQEDVTESVDESVTTSEDGTTITLHGDPLKDSFDGDDDDEELINTPNQ